MILLETYENNNIIRNKLGKLVRFENDTHKNVDVIFARENFKINSHSFVDAYVDGDETFFLSYMNVKSGPFFIKSNSNSMIIKETVDEKLTIVSFFVHLLNYNNKRPREYQKQQTLYPILFNKVY